MLLYEPEAGCGLVFCATWFLHGTRKELLTLLGWHHDQHLKQKYVDVPTSVRQTTLSSIVLMLTSLKAGLYNG